MLPVLPVLPIHARPARPPSALENVPDLIVDEVVVRRIAAAAGGVPPERRNGRQRHVLDELKRSRSRNISVATRKVLRRIEGAAGADEEIVAVMV